MNYWRLIEYLMKYLCSLALLSCSSVGVCRCSLPQISHYSFFNALNMFFCQLEMYLMFSINQTFSFDVTCLGLREACGYAPIGSDGVSSASTQPKAPDAVLLREPPLLTASAALSSPPPPTRVRDRGRKWVPLVNSLKKPPPVGQRPLGAGARSRPRGALAG